MRVKCGTHVFAIKEANLDGARILLTALDGTVYITKKYYHENIAAGVLDDLFVNDYIKVDKLTKF